MAGRNIGARRVAALGLAAGLALALVVGPPVAAQSPQADPAARTELAAVAPPETAAQTPVEGSAESAPETGPESGPETGPEADADTAPDSAEESLADQAPVLHKLGAVTNLPLPRFVSLKSNEGNVRRGPSLTHRIDWVFKRRDMPLEITAEHGHWRRVQDAEGAGGWVHYALLSGVRTVLIQEDMTPVRARADVNAPLTAAFELGVIGRLGSCTLKWCEVSAGGYKGWVEKARLWGVEPDELRE